MSTSTATTPRTAARGQAAGTAAQVVAELTDQLRTGLAGTPAGVVLFFAAADYLPEDLAGPLTAAFPEATVLGCSTAGEFTDSAWGSGGVSAIALPTSLVVRSAAALVDLSADPATGVGAGVGAIEAALGTELRTLDPTRHLGLVLIDGVHGAEEAVNEALGNAAPLLDVVGGSAGDNLVFEQTWVAVGDQVSRCGAALVVCETTGPFTVLKTCTFTPSTTKLRVTRADVQARIVYEFDGRPAPQAYADAIGVHPQDLGTEAFMAHPLGLMVDGAPFIRSPQLLTADGGIRFYCQILDGMEVEVMQPGDIIAETAAALDTALATLDGTASAGVLFNCILRRLELDAKGETQTFVDTFKDVPLAGFHTYGESWLGHMNQTLTGVLFG
jgi:hypothetical protein